MANSSLRFYIASGVLQCEEFKAQLTKGASCDRNVTGNYVQFSDDFMHLQPSSCISDELIEYLNSKATKVTLLVSSVHVEKMIEGLRPHNGSTSANMAKEFSINLSGKKISGINGISGSFTLLCEAKNSKETFELFQTFARGYFPQICVVVPFNKYLKGMSLWNRIKFVIGL